MPQADHIFEADRLEQQRGDGVQAVEPAARLVDGLADVIGGELVFEHLLVLEGITPLRHGHRAAVEPHVDQFRDAAHRAPVTVRTRPGDFVHVGPVQIEIALDPCRCFHSIRRRSRYTACGGSPYCRRSRRAAAFPSTVRGPAPNRGYSPTTIRSARF